MRLQDVVDFCEGKLAPAQFEQILMTPDAEELFADSPPIPPYTPPHARGMVYFYLIEQDYKNTACLLDIQSCLTQFLREKGVEVVPGPQAGALYNGKDTIACRVNYKTSCFSIAHENMRNAYGESKPYVSRGSIPPLHVYPGTGRH